MSEIRTSGGSEAPKTMVLSYLSRAATPPKVRYVASMFVLFLGIANLAVAGGLLSPPLGEMLEVRGWGSDWAWRRFLPPNAVG